MLADPVQGIIDQMSDLQQKPEIREAMKSTEQWIAVLNRLSKFDELEIHGVVNGILKPMLPDECIQSIYLRALGNVRTLFELKAPAHFQAVGILARSVCWLAVDISM